MDYFYEALEFGNLYKALKQCCNNVRWKDSVVGYEANALKNTLKLRENVLSGKYKLSKYQVFTIHEPKEREIVATRLVDRQLQRSLCNSGSYYELTKSFILDNVACQNGKGIDFGMRRIKKHMVRYYNKHGIDGWVLKCDISHFFQSIRHDVAKDVVTKRVTDERVRKIIFDIIDSFSGNVGIGLGSQISQLIALSVLDDMDHYIKEKLGIKFYVRYMDDFILVHNDKEYLKQCLKEIKSILENLGLALNEKTTIYPLKQGIKFCKWRYRYVGSGKILVTMDRSKIHRQRRKLKKLIQKELNGEIPEGSALTSLRCWQANAERGDSWNDIKSMYAYFNKTLKELKYANN